MPGCADIFDLPTRIIDVVRKDCNDNCARAASGTGKEGAAAVAAKDKCDQTCSMLQAQVAKEFPAYVTAVLEAQRNIVAFGCRKGPNGKSLMERLADRWAIAAGNAEYKTRSAFAQQFVGQIKQQFSSESSTDGNRNQAYSDWLDLLLQNGSLANHELLTTAPGPISKESVPTRLIELEHLQLQFAQSDVLKALVLAQWDRWTKQAVGLDPALYQSFRGSASTEMDNLNVHDLLLQGNLDSSWSLIISSVAATGSDIKKSRSNLSMQVATEFGNRLNALLANLPDSPPKRGASVPQTLLARPSFADLLGTVAAQSTSNRVNSLIPPIPDGAAANQPPAPIPTRTSAGLSVMLDGLAASGGTDSQDLTMMSGLCVLMRDKSSQRKDWRCLNVGYPMTTPPSKPDETKPAVSRSNGADLDNPVVVPVPMHNQDDLRHAILTYNNQPLMAESPVHGFSKGLVPTPTGAPDRLINFQHPSALKQLERNDPWKIPGLAFGHNYDFVIGRVSNSGALPAAFTNTNSGPAILSLSTINASANSISRSISDVVYKRTVPVGELRFGFGRDCSKDGFAKLELPPIPPDVHPRANEIYSSPDITAKGTNAKADRPTFPLLLLTPYKNKLSFKAQAKAFDSFTLGIRKPTTDLLTWDRWMAATDGPLQDRVNAWKRFHYFARQENPKYDLSLDDPAAQSLKIEIVINDVTNLGRYALDWKTPKADDPGNCVQIAAPALSLTILTDESASTSGFAKDTWTLTLRPGDIAKITLTPTVNHPELFAIDTNPQGYTFLAEAAKKEMPSIERLRHALNVIPPKKADSPIVGFELLLDGMPNSEQVGSVDLQTQVWRWDGRPSGLFPFDVIAASDQCQNAGKDLLQWELETFATRLASDATLRPMSRSNSRTDLTNRASAATAKGSAAGVADKGKDDFKRFFKARDDRGTELGATYYRAGITAYNRYGSLVPDESPGTAVASACECPKDITKLPSTALTTRAVTTLTDFASVPGANGGWTRRFIPARLPSGAKPDYAPPKPAIKFIVPLTEAADNSQPVEASVLVLVQGPWYAIAGLAEDICAKITLSDPVPTALPEAGPDPIWFAGKRSDLPTAYNDYDSIYSKDSGKSGFHGPVGHTFDSSDEDPLWVNCSFVLDPPRPTNGNLGRSSFARVQFQRVIRQAGLVVPDDKGNLIAATKSCASAWTDPVWIQFLPSRFSAFTAKVQSLCLDIRGNTASIKNQDTIVALSDELNPSQDPERHLLFGLLLTEQVEDLLGRKQQERFVDFLLNPATSGQTNRASWVYSPKVSNPPPSSSKLIGRIVAIERQINVTPPPGAKQCDGTIPARFIPSCSLKSADELWKELFPDDDRDAIARIVAVSPPIAKTVSLTCTDSGVKP